MTVFFCKAAMFIGDECGNHGNHEQHLFVQVLCVFFLSFRDSIRSVQKSAADVAFCVNRCR